MRTLHIAAECTPLIKTGGLADVIGALPAAQCALGTDARVLLPGYQAVLAGLSKTQLVATLPQRFGVATPRLFQGRLPNGVIVYTIEADAFYHRDADPYVDGYQQPYPDNHLRFALLAWIATEIACGLIPDWVPDVLHAHDWHAGLTAAYLQQRRQQRPNLRTSSVFTIHNLAYQGLFALSCFPELDLPNAYAQTEGMEFYGQLSFLKAGLYYSDRLTTVSPSYAQEIQTTELGCGMDGLLRQRRQYLSGILNGVADEWNPATDTAITSQFDADHLALRPANKLALQREMGLIEDPDAPLFGMVSRLTEQKGFGLLLAGAEEIMAKGGQLLVLGTGDIEIQAKLQQLQRHYPRRVSTRFGFDEYLSHRIFSGADVILVPSRFEPCGLTQLYAMRYGALPLVRRTGGLADTVKDCSLENLADGSASGFVFARFDQADFDSAIRRAFALYKDRPRWEQVQRHAMERRFGWGIAASRHIQLYDELQNGYHS